MGRFYPVCRASAGPAGPVEPPFQVVTYRTADGKKSITLKSATELDYVADGKKSSGTYAQVVSPCHVGLPWGGSLLQ